MSGRTEHVCLGPDGGQLLGFLCSLGLLESSTRALPEHDVRLGFIWQAIGFRPVLTTDPSIDRDNMVDLVLGWISQRASSRELSDLGDDLPCDVTRFQSLALELISTGGRSSDLLAAFGIVLPDTQSLEDTAFRTMSGAGHQHFLKFARRIAEETTRAQVENALFDTWRYEDPGPSLRFDPADDRRYALRADDPSSASSSAPIRTVRAANALAFEGLGFLTVIPTNVGIATILVQRSGRSTMVRWPVWERPLTRDATAGLLSTASMATLPGVTAVFEARRLTVGKFRAFTPARRLH